MIDRHMAHAPAAGRPSAGHLLKQAFQTAAGKRLGRKDLGPLAGLWPYLKAHPVDTFWGLLFVVVSSVSTLGLTVASRGLVDHGFKVHTPRALLGSFLIAAAAAALFALATAFRIYFVNKLGERVVVDLRKAVYDHVLKLDLAQVIKVRTGELLSRMTTDMTIVERMISNGAPVALKDIGMKAQDLDKACEIAMGNQYPNPRPLEREAIRGLLQDAFQGARPA